MKRKITVWILISFIGLTSLPYWIAVQATEPGNVFGGFLYNPIDGNSYLAKIMEGAQGNWQFYLPFTAEHGNSSYLFLFYLFLGHVSAWTGIAPIWVFHIARILAIIALIFALEKFLLCFVPEDSFKTVFILTVFGAGLGWLGLVFRVVTSDLTVPEAYPFLAGFANPHFPFALAIILFLFSIKAEQPSLAVLAAYLLGGLLLAILLPFAAVLVIIVSGLTAAWTWLSTRQVDWRLPVLAFVGAVPMIAYQYALTQIDPLLKIWNAQNLTPSPYLYDFILSFSPAILLAIPGAAAILRGSKRDARLLVVWAAVGMLLTYLPFGLQRRFMVGLFIPLAGLAGIGLEGMLAVQPKFLRIAKMAVVAISLPTSIVVIMLGIFGALRNDPIFYLSQAEQNGMDWLKRSEPAGSVILAAPETSMYIPGRSGDRVVYGHPFETIHVVEKKAWVLEFFQGKFNAKFSPSPRDQSVDFIWVGPRERALGFLTSNLDTPIVFQQDAITIYQVPK